MLTNFELIEKYIEGELKGDELLKLEELLSTDSGMKRDYKLSLEINNSIMEDDVMALRETMNYMYQDETKIKRIPAVFTKRKFYYYAAASAALLIASGGLVQRLSNPGMDTIGIYDKYYAPYDVTVTYRSGNAEVDRLLLNALERYEDKDYEKALLLFEKVLETRQNDMAVNLYSGISYMEEEKYQKATNSFKNIISDKDNLFIEQAKWYLAMCYLRTEKTEKAKDVLHEIINEESYYKDKAENVLREMHN